MSLADEMTAHRAGIDDLTDTERRYLLYGLATRWPDQVTRAAVYVHERRVWYPDPPAKEQ